MATCAICLAELETPVCTPCGHLHCEECLSAYVASSEDAVDASCPTCRSPFSTVQPDLRFIPAKLHKFIIPTVRRVFLDIAAAPPGPSNENENNDTYVQELKDQISELENRASGLARDKLLLMERCESTMSASANHARREKTTRMENTKLKKRIEELEAAAEESKRKYDGLKVKLKDLKDKLDEPQHPQPPRHPSLLSASKRSRTQADLEPLPLSPTSTNVSFKARLFEYGADGRPIVPIPKRPRIHHGAPWLSAAFRLSQHDYPRVSSPTTPNPTPPFLRAPPVFKGTSSSRGSTRGSESVEMTPASRPSTVLSSSSASSSTKTPGSASSSSSNNRTFSSASSSGSLSPWSFPSVKISKPRNGLAFPIIRNANAMASSTISEGRASATNTTRARQASTRHSEDRR